MKLNCVWSIPKPHIVCQTSVQFSTSMVQCKRVSGPFTQPNGFLLLTHWRWSWIDDSEDEGPCSLMQRTRVSRTPIGRPTTACTFSSRRSNMALWSSSGLLRHVNAVVHTSSYRKTHTHEIMDAWTNKSLLRNVFKHSRDIWLSSNLHYWGPVACLVLLTNSSESLNNENFGLVQPYLTLLIL